VRYGCPASPTLKRSVCRENRATMAMPERGQTRRATMVRNRLLRHVLAFSNTTFAPSRRAHRLLTGKRDRQEPSFHKARGLIGAGSGFVLS